jgi:threonine dehydrogenase-like Zn-dependent dehydrogenase
MENGRLGVLRHGQTRRNDRVKQMLAGQIVGRRQLEIIELPIPEAGEGQILVRLEAGAICGSDLPYFLMEEDHPSIAAALRLGHGRLPPLFSLHELVGRVAQSRCREFAEGDRVLALPYQHQGLAVYFLSEPAMAVPVPEGPAERLSLAQPLGTVVHACLKLPNVLGQTAVVIGQGPIGQLFTALLRRMGVMRLIAVDLLPDRLEVSRTMGATDTLCGDAAEVMAAMPRLTGAHGVDLAVEAVGLAETLNLASSLVRRNGTLLAFGVPHRTHYPFAFREFFFNEGRLINSIGPDVHHDFPIAVEMIASGLIDTGPLITHRFPFSRAHEAFTLFADRADGSIKVVLRAED